MKPDAPARTIYPSLPDILDQETLALVATLESRERAFAMQAKKPRAKHLRALYLKAMPQVGTIPKLLLMCRNWRESMDGSSIKD